MVAGTHFGPLCGLCQFLKARDNYTCFMVLFVNKRVTEFQQANEKESLHQPIPVLDCRWVESLMGYGYLVLEMDAHEDRGWLGCKFRVLSRFC
ncbi:uncharacterized protein LOC18778457 isoform X2 [Prunus persica]|uniref:uncharacterized protein LOC18778457 isoform X2 n=1 Tax=Prunus persica TaxID=3760 RepID=UPI0009AB417E|nr:uncharacterized protein LOC18778457 isoform X2 [Prunus persica]